MDLVTNTIIKRKNASEGGLIGGWFSFEKNGQVYGISCNHVIANINACRVGDILANETNDDIGVLSHWLQLKAAQNGFTNKAEFALFLPKSNLTPLWRAKPSGFVNGTVDARVDFRCDDYASRGTITNISHPVSITWNNIDYHFRCIEVKSETNGSFSKPGHSGGSVYCDEKLLGIILGINETGDKTYVVPFADGILNLVALAI